MADHVQVSERRGRGAAAGAGPPSAGRTRAAGLEPTRGPTGRVAAARSRRAAARPAARGLSRLPDRGPPPSPPTRPHASREALEGRTGQRARTAAARGLRAALGEPSKPGGRGPPSLTVLRGPPRSQRRLSLVNKKRALAREPRSPDSFRSPSSSRPRIRETPFSVWPSLPLPRDALRSHFPLAQPGGPSTPSSKMGAEALLASPRVPLARA